MDTPTSSPSAPRSEARSAAYAAARMLALFAACTAAFYALLVQNPGWLVDIDALYHYRVASLIRTRGPWVDIDWLPYTILGTHGTDHQWLFHVLIAPLTALGDGFEAVMFACAATGAAVATALYALLRAVGVPYAALFAVAAIVGADMMPERFIALRAQDLAIVLSLAAILAIARGRNMLLALTAFASAGAVASTSAPNLPPLTGVLAGKFLVIGDVAHPALLDVHALAALRAHTETVTFKAGSGSQTHNYVGPLLVDVLTQAGPQFDPTIKNDKLRH